MSTENMGPDEVMQAELRRTLATAILSVVGGFLAFAGVMIGVVRILQKDGDVHPHVFEGIVVCLFSLMLGIVIALAARTADAVLRSQVRAGPPDVG